LLEENVCFVETNKKPGGEAMREKGERGSRSTYC